VVLRRQPAQIVDGQPEGGYTDDLELICCHCGDDPELDYREVSPPAAAGPPRLGLMADNSLSVRDRESFLAEPHVAALSVSAGQSRGPFTVPIWYQYAPGGEAWVLTEAGSRKVRLIETAGRFTLMVERVLPTVRYVSVEGPVTRTVPGTDELLRDIAARYLPPDKVRAYIDFAKAELGEQVAIYLRPERWLTADLGPGAVPPRVP
jgi:hypothetical protein